MNAKQTPARLKYSTLMKSRIQRLLLIFVFFTLGRDNSHGQVTLYDNTDLALGRGERLAHPMESWMFAQPFRTDERNTTITSIELAMGRFGLPEGELRVSIWDQQDGLPGQLIGNLGKIDANFLPLVVPFQPVLEKISFREVPIDLEPNSTYYLNLDLSDVISTPFDEGEINNVVNGATRSQNGTNAAEPLLTTDRGEINWVSLPFFGLADRWLQMSVEATVGGFLQAGDADQDLDFDQFDLVKVQVASKYLTGQAATWGEGDWDGAPGGQQDNPPAGNGLFDQLDIIAALAPGHYLTGRYAVVGTGGSLGDGQTSITYDAGTGEVGVDAPAGIELTSINIDSAGGIFTGVSAENLGGSFDNDADANIFKATFGGSFGSASFGNVAEAGLSEAFVLNDLNVVGSLAGGGDLGNVDLVYVPEPTSILLLTIGTLIGLLHFRRASR